jgi:hypothetical protein
MVTPYPNKTATLTSFHRVRNMSGQVTITQLPNAGALTGNESVPIVQNGQTVQTTTAAIAGAGALNYPFLTVGSTAGLTQARYLSVNTGLTLSDGGAGGTMRIGMNGAAASLNSAGTGIQVKTDANTVIPRQIAVGAAMTISNADGVAGNPTINVNALLQNFGSQTGTGILAMQSGNVGKISILGVTNQISIANGDGSSNVSVGIATNPVLPGTESVNVPSGTTAQRPGSPTNGMLRYNTTTATFEGYANGTWGAIAAGGGVTSVGTGTGLLGGPITSTGTISIDNTVVATLTDAQTLTNKTISGANNTITNIGNSSLTNSSITINGSSVSLGGSVSVGTVTSVGGTGTVNGLTLTGTVTGSGNLTLGGTLSGIPNSALTNSSITLGTTTIALGATALAPAGLTSVTVTQDPVSALQLATKQYVDSVAQGLNVKPAVYVATTANITLSGEQTIDGFLTSGSRVLVKNQSTSSQNGIYVSSSGAWTRATDANTWNQLISAFVFVEVGTINADTGWVCTVDPGGTLGVTAVTWAQFSGAGTYTAGTGLTLTGTQFSLTAPVTAALGGSGYTSYATGDMLYASGSTALSKLTIGTSNYVMTSSGTAPQWVAQSTLSVGSATNATNTGITANSTNATNYLTFVSATTGNLPQLVNSSITCNPSTGSLTGGIAGGAF